MDRGRRTLRTARRWSPLSRDAHGRAGRTRFGYLEPSEAAWKAAEILAGKSRKRRLPGEILDQVPAWASGLERIAG